MYQGLGVSKEIYPCLLFAIQQDALILRNILQKAYNSGLFDFQKIKNKKIYLNFLTRRKKCI